MKKPYNIAFIDGQNLILSTKRCGWKVDIFRFRKFLEDKYSVREAYYFLWCVQDAQEDLYFDLQRAWFIVQFREHSSNMAWLKKWNVDTDIVFEVMRRVIESKENDEDSFDKFVLVSGDGDYIKMVKFLIKKELFDKVLFPWPRYSSLYKPVKELGLTAALYDPETQNKIEYKKTREAS